MKKCFVVCLALILLSSCSFLIKKAKKETIARVVLTASRSENNFEYSEQNKGSIIFNAWCENEDGEKIANEKIEWESNLPENVQVIEEEGIYTINLDSIKRLGEYTICAKAKNAKDIKQNYNLVITTSENFLLKYSYILMKEDFYNRDENTFIELDKNQNKITKDNQRISFDENISLYNTGENGICLFADEMKFGEVKYEVEENENFLYNQHNNFLYVFPLDKLNEDYSKELCVKVIAGDKEKSILIKINNSVNTEIAKPTIYDAENSSDGGVNINITGDSIGISNFLHTQFFRKDKNGDWQEFSEWEKSSINYGEQYKILRTGEYKVETYVSNKIGERSQVNEKEFNIAVMDKSNFEGYFTFNSQNSSKPSYISSYIEDDEIKSARQALYSIKMDNCIYNTQVLLEYKSSDDDFESEKSIVNVEKDSVYQRSFAGSGEYKVYVYSNSNFSYGNISEEDLSENNAIIYEFSISNADSINSMEWVSESVSSNSTNTEMYSAITANDEIFSINENAVICMSVFDKNAKTYKKNFNLTKSSKNYTYTITDTKEYEIIGFVYIPGKAYVSNIRKTQIFMSKGVLKAKPSINQSDDIQDGYNKRKVAITNTKNFNGQGRNLYYAWSSSKTTTPNSWNTLCSNGNSTSKYELYLKDSSKYLWIKSTPFNENIEGEVIFATYITLPTCSSPTARCNDYDIFVKNTNSYTVTICYGGENRDAGGVGDFHTSEVEGNKEISFCHDGIPGINWAGGAIGGWWFKGYARRYGYKDSSISWYSSGNNKDYVDREEFDTSGWRVAK